MSDKAAAADDVPPPVVSGDGSNIPAEFLKLSYSPQQPGREAVPGVTLDRKKVLSWRDRGDVVAVVTAVPVEGRGWRSQKVFAVKAGK